MDVKQQRPGLAPSKVNVGFVVDKVALGQVFVRVLLFFPVDIIPLLLHIHSCIIRGMDKGSVRDPFPQRQYHPIATITRYTD
jgi:hypothetical protein